MVNFMPGGGPGIHASMYTLGEGGRRTLRSGYIRYTITRMDSRELCSRDGHEPRGMAKAIEGGAKVSRHQCSLAVMHSDQLDEVGFRGGHEVVSQCESSGREVVEMACQYGESWLFVVWVVRSRILLEEHELDNRKGGRGTRPQGCILERTICPQCGGGLKRSGLRACYPWISEGYSACGREERRGEEVGKGSSAGLCTR